VRRVTCAPDVPKSSPGCKHGRCANRPVFAGCWWARLSQKTVRASVLQVRPFRNARRRLRSEASCRRRELTPPHALAAAKYRPRCQRRACCWGSCCAGARRGPLSLVPGEAAAAAAGAVWAAADIRCGWRWRGRVVSHARAAEQAQAAQRGSPRGLPEASCGYGCCSCGGGGGGGGAWRRLPGEGWRGGTRRGCVRLCPRLSRVALWRPRRRRGSGGWTSALQCQRPSEFGW
jgi:hypothetical protein